jgi:hypothetical protein
MNARPALSMNLRMGTLIINKLRLFPLTPALSLGERENGPQTRMDTVIPVGGWPSGSWLVSSSNRNRHLPMNRGPSAHWNRRLPGSLPAIPPLLGERAGVRADAASSSRDWTNPPEPGAGLV